MEAGMKAQPAHGRAPFACTHSRRSVGFSLVELILVVTAISVLALIAFPRFANAKSRSVVEGAAHRMKADIERAQVFARAASRSVRLEVDTGSSSYTVTGLRPLDGPGTNTQVSLGRDPYRVTIVDARLTDGGSFAIDGYGRFVSGGKLLLRAGNAERVVEWLAADSGINVRPPLFKEFN